MKLPMIMLLPFLLVACNLQQEPQASPTVAPVVDTPPGIASQTPLLQTQPTLLPTPTQLVLTTVTPLPVPTTIDIIGGDTRPTLDATLADERYELQARANQTVGINYDVTVTRGTVMMIMQGPDGLIWEKTFTTTEKGREEIAVTQGGTYEILVTRQQLDGNYAVSWD
jgi:hypothetical protein